MVDGDPGGLGEEVGVVLLGAIGGERDLVDGDCAEVGVVVEDDLLRDDHPGGEEVLLVLLQGAHSGAEQGEGVEAQVGAVPAEDALLPESRREVVRDGPVDELHVLEPHRHLVLQVVRVQRRRPAHPEPHLHRVEHVVRRRRHEQPRDRQALVRLRGLHLVLQLPVHLEWQVLDLDQVRVERLLAVRRVPHYLTVLVAFLLVQVVHRDHRVRLRLVVRSLYPQLQHYRLVRLDPLPDYHPSHVLLQTARELCYLL